MTAAETAKFTLDTSGIVDHWRGNRLGVRVGPTYWPDLDPFTQGYVEALLRGFSDKLTAALSEPPFVGFSDLAPSTLAAILKDCAEFRVTRGTSFETREWGRWFYEQRQFRYFPDFPPLTPSLGEDGKVYLRAAS